MRQAHPAPEGLIVQAYGIVLVFGPFDDIGRSLHQVSRPTTTGAPGRPLGSCELHRRQRLIKRHPHAAVMEFEDSIDVDVDTRLSRLVLLR